MASLDEVLASLSTEAPGAATRRTTEIAMSKTTPTAPTAEVPTLTPEAHEAALTTARAEGASTERSRITAILRSETATGREAQAIALALDTDIAADAALKVLAATPIVMARAAATIAERAAAETEMGAATQTASVASQAAERTTRGWKAAVAQANQRFALPAERPT